MEGYVRDRVVYDTEPFGSITAYVLIPDALPAGTVPGILCCHGHGTGKDSLVGTTPGDLENRHNYQRVLAVRRVQRGISVLRFLRCLLSNQIAPSTCIQGQARFLTSSGHLRRTMAWRWNG